MYYIILIIAQFKLNSNVILLTTTLPIVVSNHSKKWNKLIKNKKRKWYKAAAYAHALEQIEARRM